MEGLDFFALGFVAGMITSVVIFHVVIFLAIKDVENDISQDAEK